MKPKTVSQTLKSVSSFESVVNSVALQDLPVKKACVIGANSIEAWGLVINEFNDVITTLENEQDADDQIYRAAFCKALQIVMWANKYTRGNVK